jgi:hypothetical protein
MKFYFDTKLFPCLVDHGFTYCNSCVFFASSQPIPGLTDVNIPRRLGPKRASKIRKLFNLSKEDDVRQYVIKRPLPVKEGKKPRFKAPKIQRLITPRMLQVRSKAVVHCSSFFLWPMRIGTMEPKMSKFLARFMLMVPTNRS